MGEQIANAAAEEFAAEIRRLVKEAVAEAMAAYKPGVTANADKVVNLATAYKLPRGDDDGASRATTNTTTNNSKNGYLLPRGDAA
jgi:hypothetical protein